MRKKIISVILFILITFLATTIYAVVAANATLSASKTKVKQGESFTVKLSIKDINAGTDGLMGAQLKIDYSKDVFETLTDANIKGLSGLTANYNEGKKGNILILTVMSGIKSDSDFVEVTFKAKENAELKDATITFQDIEIFNLEKANIGNKSVIVEITDKDIGGENTPAPTPNGGSESTPTPSTKPGGTDNTPTPTATAKPNNGQDKNDVPVTNIDTNTSSGSSSSGSSTNKGSSGSSSSSTLKGSTTSSSSLPKAGIGSAVTVLTVVAAIIGMVSYIKLRNYREI